MACSAGKRWSCRPALPTRPAGRRCVWPIGSRFIQRCSEATQSRASTGLAVVEQQPVAQAHRPAQPVVLHLMALDHLRLRIELLVAAIQRLEHHRGAVAGDERGGPDRIEACEVRLRHMDQRLRPWPPTAGCASEVRPSAAVAAPARKLRRFILDVPPKHEPSIEPMFQQTIPGEVNRRRIHIIASAYGRLQSLSLSERGTSESRPSGSLRPGR